jgi:hypothetical protein
MINDTEEWESVARQASVLRGPYREEVPILQPKRRDVTTNLKLTTHLQLVPRSRKCGSIHPLPIHLHGVMFN